MDKKIKICIAVFITIVGLIMYADATKPKPINWFPSYVAKHKTPYGTYVLKEQLSNLFPRTEVKEIKKSICLPIRHDQNRDLFFCKRIYKF